MIKRIVFGCILILLGIGASCQVNRIDWSRAAVLPGSEGGQQALGVSGAVTGISQGCLIVAGGSNFPGAMPWAGGKKHYYQTIYVLSGDDGHITGTQVNPQTLPEPVAYAADAVTPRGIVYAGGENEQGLSDKVCLLQYDHSSGQVGVSALPALPVPLTNAAAAYWDNRVFVAGGASAAGPSRTFYVLEMVPGAAWKRLPDLPLAVTHAVLIAQTGGDKPCLYLVGGRCAGADQVTAVYDQTWQYSIGEGKWTGRHPLPYALSAASGVARGASYILLFSGDRGPMAASAAATGTTATGTAATGTAATAGAGAVSHPFSRDVLLYNTVTDVWTKIDSIPFPGQVTTTALTWGKTIVIPCGEIRAGVRTPDIITGVIRERSYFSYLDYCILGVYFLLMIYIGWWSSGHQHSVDDYFKAGKKIPAWASGLSIFGAKLSAITFISIPAKTYGLDWTNLFFLMTIVMVMPVVLKFFIPFYRRLNVTTAYEYLELRFNYGARFLASFLFVLLQIGRMGIVLLLPSLALTVVTGIGVVPGIIVMGVVSMLYTVLGGIEAVIWTEVVQVLILLGGALITVVIIPFMIPDWHAALNDVWINHKLKTFDFRFDFSTTTFWVVVLGGLATHINIYGCDQTVVQRYLTTADQKSAEKSLKLGAWMTVPSSLLFFSIGTLLYVFYRAHPASVNIALDNQDTIFPWFMVSQLPRGIAGLVITAIFAASMGSLNSSVNSVATVIVNDWARHFFSDLPVKTYLRMARITTLGIGIFATGIALLMAAWNIPSLWDQFNMLVGLFTGGTAGIFLLGMFSRRANGPGVVCGLIASALLQYFMKNYTTVHLFVFAVTGLVSSLVLGYIFSLLFTPDKEKSLEGLIYKRGI
jgi:SSS family solute:Na+ symporter